MAHVLHQKPVFYPPHKEIIKHNLWSRLIKFSVEQEKNRLGWVGGSILAHAAIVYPFTMAMLYLNGFPFILIMAAAIAMVMVIVVNITGMPTKTIIPTFVLSVILDVLVIILSFLA